MLYLMRLTMNTPIEKDTEALTKKLSDLFDKIYTKGHVDGSTAALGPDFNAQNIQIAKELNPYLFSFEAHLQQTLNKEILLRYGCDSRRNLIAIAILVEENFYIENFRRIYEYLKILETSLFQHLNFLSNFLIETTVVTYSDLVPLDQDAIDYDFQFVPQSDVGKS